jgi:hypothetical protein
MRRLYPRGDRTFYSLSDCARYTSRSTVSSLFTGTLAALLGDEDVPVGHCKLAGYSSSKVADLVVTSVGF